MVQPLQERMTTPCIQMTTAKGLLLKEDEIISGGEKRGGEGRGDTTSVTCWACTYADNSTHMFQII